MYLTCVKEEETNDDVFVLTAEIPDTTREGGVLEDGYLIGAVLKHDFTKDPLYKTLKPMVLAHLLKAYRGELPTIQSGPVEVFLI